MVLIVEVVFMLYIIFRITLSVTSNMLVYYSTQYVNGFCFIFYTLC